MPNHLHGIIVIGDRCCSRGEAFVFQMLRPYEFRKFPVGTQAGSVGAIVQNFKSVSTRQVNVRFFAPGCKLWQRNYFERIIRDERELDIIRVYIRENPTVWEQDWENPDNPGVKYGGKSPQ